ncbi:putative cyclin-dependent protein kinase complex component [Erysiphe necator]|uniref:Putative cyclin-dependent protein kinase complex component n=1 Tax=Uncinula necator TaxID=52586 RepID=A0A0B1P2P5_UNCNE|nr:putative cyclin-dependent protein kinase complex component [Erysiphe necator]
MAALISDFISDSGHFQHNHKMISGSSKQLSPAEAQYLKISSLRDIHNSPHNQPISLPNEQQLSNTDSTKLLAHSGNTDDKALPVKIGVVSPPSSSKIPQTRHKFISQENILRPSLQSARSPQNSSQDLKKRKSSYSSTNSTYSASLRSSASFCDVKVSSVDKIKVQSLAHIQKFAFDDSVFLGEHHGNQLKEYNSSLAYEISSMPITDVIEMVAGLLTKIVTTNDRQHSTRSKLPQSSDSYSYISDNTSKISAFHGKNVPNISILSYLSRIHKYCPTTYEVFLSLLIYFDRMTEKFNKVPIKTEERQITDSAGSISSSEDGSYGAEPSRTPQISSKDHKDTYNNSRDVQNTSDDSNNIYSHEITSSRLFVVDSYNIHRLVIAAVTCASKFFSDIFYTNSRYAKVGGLPLLELNHLELQFLLLNDFRLFVPVEEFEVYGTMLVEFYAREVINQKQQTASVEIKYPKESSSPNS